MTRQCKRCRRWWNVSIRAKQPKRGYICPECSREQRPVKIWDGRRVS